MERGFGGFQQSGRQGELTLPLLCMGEEPALLTSHLQKPAGWQRALPPELPFTVTSLRLCGLQRDLQQGTGSLSDLSLVWAALPKTLVRACDFILLFSREHFLAGPRLMHMNLSTSAALIRVPGVLGCPCPVQVGCDRDEREVGALQTSLLPTQCAARLRAGRGTPDVLVQ